MTNENLLEIKQQLQTIFDTVPALIFYKDKENNFVKVNKAYIEAVGAKSYEDVVGKNVADFMEEPEKFLVDDLEVMSTGVPKKIIESVNYFHDGENKIKWYETTKLPYINKNGETIGIIGIAIDITEHIQLCDQLKITNKKLNEIIENIEDTFVVISDEKCNLHNKKWSELMGKTSQDVVKEKFQPYMKTVMETGTSIEVKDCEIPINDDGANRYYNFLFYKYNGGIAILGRKVLDTPSQLSVKLSEANARLDQIIAKSV